jgi:hypothetical protein
MDRDRKTSMVEAMSRPSRKLLRYGAAAAFFTGGVAVVVAGWAAALAWTLIVVGLVCATQGTSTTLPGARSEHVRGGPADSGAERVAEGHRYLAERRRSPSHPGRRA